MRPRKPETPAGRSVLLFLCGNVMLGRGIDQILPYPGDPWLNEGYMRSALEYVRLAEAASGVVPRTVPFDYVWGDALPELARAQPQARIVNLETSVTKSATYLPKGINYRMSPDNIGVLATAAIDCCVLANNHVLDFGRDGLIETLDTHHPKAIEVYRDQLILYGCGDFLNDYEGISGHEEYRGDLSLMYLPRLCAATGRLIDLHLVPFKIARFQLHRASAADAAWLQHRLSLESQTFGVAIALDSDGAPSAQWG